MNNDLSGKKVAILATNGFELSELQSPKDALKAAGALVEIISLKSGTIKGWSGGDWKGEETVDRTVENANADDYDALLLPGGVLVLLIACLTIAGERFRDRLADAAK